MFICRAGCRAVCFWHISSCLCSHSDSISRASASGLRVLEDGSGVSGDELLLETMMTVSGYSWHKLDVAALACSGSRFYFTTWRWRRGSFFTVNLYDLDSASRSGSSHIIGQMAGKSPYVVKACVVLQQIFAALMRRIWQISQSQLHPSDRRSRCQQE